MTAPALYTQLVLLDRDRHRLSRVRPWTDRTAAGALNAVYCAAAEFAEACKAFPLLFIRNGEQDASGKPVITPVCLLGLQDGENLFIDGGTWAASYEPAFLRRYPFALVQAASPDGADTQAVAIDATFDGLADDGPGERLFGDDGTPTPHLDQVLQFATDYEAAVQMTRPVGAYLQSLGLLKDMRAEGALAHGERFAVDGFLVVDEEKLRTLADETVVALHRNGVMALIHAHLVSLSNLAQLVQRKSARIEAARR